MSYFLSIKDDRVQISRNHGDEVVVIKSMADFRTFIDTVAKATGVNAEDVPVYASSSMDFPDEFTNNAAVIALARELRS